MFCARRLQDGNSCGRKKNPKKRVERNERTELVFVTHLLKRFRSTKNADWEREGECEQWLQWPQIQHTTSSRHSNKTTKKTEFFVFYAVFAELIGDDYGATAAAVLLHDSFELNKMWMPTAKKLERICICTFCAPFTLSLLVRVGKRSQAELLRFIILFESKIQNRLERHSSSYNRLYSDGVARLQFPL